MINTSNYKADQFNFIILCPEKNLGGIKSTIHGIKDNYPESRISCMVGNTMKDKELQEFKSICPNLIQGGNTITSLINLGLKKSKSEWNIVIMAGSRIDYWLLRKYNVFLTSEKDILYPVVNRKWKFDEATINGLVLNRKAITEVGEFDNNLNDIRLVKLLWSDEALKKQYKFKAICGIRL